MTKDKQCGSVLTEALPVTLLLVTFVSALLLGSYLIFARAWLSYQGEQALYCLSTRQSKTVCEQRLRSKTKAALPWGKIRSLKLSTDAKGLWRLDLYWQVQAYQLVLRKQLSVKGILARRALHW